LEQAKAAIQAQVVEHAELQPLVDFLAASERGIIR
jgi:acyl-[acyl carrier protein]--UDP-N-acetylglucosamine O-acyltransferase